MKVLIATDGSEYSKRAIQESCRFLANTKDAEIKVLSIYKCLDPMPTVPFVIPENYPSQFSQEAEKEARKIVREAAHIIIQKYPEIELTADIEKLSVGTVGQKIIEKTKEWEADLIVVGSHGRGFWGRLAMGSTSDDVVHQASCPVLVVH